MTVDALLQYVEQFGYFALFFALWLGIVGMPIPDEAVVMTGGMVASLHILQILPAFIVTYLGVVSGLSLGYVLGRMMGPPIVERLMKRKNMRRPLERSQRLLERYGRATLIFSYFLPVVRHVVPYLVGVHRMPFGWYALYSYSTGLVWTAGFFTVGYYFGGNIERIAAAVYRYGWFVLAGAGCVALAVWGVRSLRQRNVSN
ncbi:DedA family protein [Paenibacillus sp. GD4]|uniref:DedA family protein n=1 Tax=Paenibacillus TaxID=44249 RepID=UPI0025434E0A|nr:MULTISPECIES: DedA family protein [Paenibacillus]MDQ1913198.1 DedA family protein [Paenibacillus sp. GD4]